MLRYHFVWCFPAQDFTWIVIHPIHRLLEFLLTDFCEVCSLGKEAAQKPVVIFIGTLLPGGVTVAVIYLKPFSSVYGLRKLLILQKFRSVVCGDTLEYFLKPLFAQLPFQLIEDGPDGSRFFIWYDVCHFRASLPVCHGQRSGWGAFLSDNQINFLVANLIPAVDLLWPVCDGGQGRVCNPVYRIIGPFFLLAFLQ